MAASKAGKQPIKMTDEQKALFNKLTPLKQEVSLNSIRGMNDIDAYRNSSGKAKTLRAMETSVSEIMRNHEVKAFIDSMKEVAVSDAVMSREEMLERLTELSRIDMSEIVKGDKETLTEFKQGFDIKLKAVQGSMKQLAELAGYEAPKKVDMDLNSVSVDIDVTVTPEEAAKLYTEMMEGK